MPGDTGPKGNQGPQGLQGNEVRVLFFCNIRLQEVRLWVRGRADFLMEYQLVLQVL